MDQEQVQAAWSRMEALGGHGVWEADMVVISLKGTGVTDGDLAILKDIPVQILDLSDNSLSDDCLVHLRPIQSLESLILIGNDISEAAVEEFRSNRPNVEIQTTLVSKETINPWTGKPFGSE